MPKMPILKLSLALGKLSDMGENTGDDERVSSCECLTRRIRAGLPKDFFAQKPTNIGRLDEGPNPNRPKAYLPIMAVTIMLSGA